MAKKKTQSQKSEVRSLKSEGGNPKSEFPESSVPKAEVPEVSGEMRGKPLLSIESRAGLLGTVRGGRFFPVRDEEGRMVRVGVTDRQRKMECVACASVSVTAAAECASCGGDLHLSGS